MRSQERAAARRALDRRLEPIRGDSSLLRPALGWVRAIREALGLTNKQLGQRLGVSAPRVVALQKAEKNGAITLESLRRAADALNCELVYALVPRVPLAEQVDQQALKVAQRRLQITGHSMALEDQAIGGEEEAIQLRSLARELADRGGKALWEDE